MLMLMLFGYNSSSMETWSHERFEDDMVETTRLVQLLDSEDAAAWSQTLVTLAREQGFDRVLYGMVGSRHAKLEQAFILSNYSPGWRERYDANHFAYVDPVVAHCLSSCLPLVWVGNTFRTPAQRALYEEACGFGIRVGVSLPVHGPNGEFGVLSFASDERSAPRFERAAGEAMAALALIRDYAFASVQRFCGASAVAEPVPRLTRRELEVLNWVMAGKSSWEVARITNCSEATVNFHMANVRQKFNVNTRQQAVVKAIALGLITPEDHHR
jgi:LuxR family quorum-sensing transcriptional regulator LasR